MSRQSTLAEPRASVELLLEAFSSVADEFAEKTTAEIIASIPELHDLPDLEAEVSVMARASARSFIETLDPDNPVEPVVPIANVEFARTLVVRGLEFTVFLKVYRVAVSSFWKQVMAWAARETADVETGAAALQLVWERLQMWTEFVLECQLQVYQAELDRRMRRGLQRRQAMIQALLADEPVRVDTASAALGHELRRSQIAAVLWIDTDDARPDPIERLERVARALAASVDSKSALVTASGPRAVWAWIGSDSLPRPEQFAQSALLAAAEGVRVALGRPGHGTPGFRRSHIQAVAAHRAAVAMASPPVLTHYADDIELVHLLSRDVESMRELVYHELGGLAAPDAHIAELRATALAYLATGCSANAAAHDLGVHRNTVAYRLRQIEELVGRPLNNRRPHLQLALMLMEHLGQASMS